MFTHRMLQWQVSDVYGRPMFNTNGKWPENYFKNMSACSSAGTSIIVEEMQEGVKNKRDCAMTNVHTRLLAGKIVRQFLCLDFVLFAVVTSLKYLTGYAQSSWLLRQSHKDCRLGFESERRIRI
jgi:Na+/alanine symporter